MGRRVALYCRVSTADLLVKSQTDPAIILMAVVGIATIFGLEKIYLSRTPEMPVTGSKP